MAVSNWTEADTARALQIWADYQKQHAVLDKKGLTAGIDPATGKVWFGESSVEVVQRMQADGIDNPLYFIRVGFDYYLRKGGHR
jgi:hypothetical protein